MNKNDFSPWFKEYIFKEIKRRANDPWKQKNPKQVLIILSLILADKTIPPRILQEMRFDSMFAAGEDWSTYMVGTILALTEEFCGIGSDLDKLQTTPEIARGNLILWRVSAKQTRTGIILSVSPDSFIVAVGEREKFITAKLRREDLQVQFSDFFPKFTAHAPWALS